MIRRRFLLLAVLPLLCGATPIDAASSGDITEVTLERTPCFGACPEDTLILRKDGTAAYLGRRNV